MKALLVIASLVVSSVAFAMPSVNDSASYDVVVTQGNQSQHITYDASLTEYNSGQDTFKMVEVTTVHGQQPQTQEGWVKGEDLASDELVAELLTNCAKYRGKAGKVTVPAGTFDSCALPQNNNGVVGTLWVAKVSFGIAKIEQSNGRQKMVMALKSFKLGQ